MKIRKQKHSIRLLVTVAILLMALTAIARPAFATIKNTNLHGKITSLSDTVTMYLGAKTGYVKSMNKYSCDPTKLTYYDSSKRDVVVPYSYAYEKAFTLFAQSAGTSRVKYTYAGQSRTIKVVVKRYEKPISKLMVGSANLTSKFSKAASCSCPIAKYRNKKVTVRPAEGWKIKGIYTGRLRTNDMVYTAIKNGTKLPNAKFDQICVLMQNKTTKGYNTLYIYKS